MQRLVLIILCSVLFACGENATQTPTTQTAQSTPTQDFSTIKQFSVINSGFREYQGAPAAWVMFTKPLKRSLDIEQFISLSSTSGLLSGGWHLDKAGNNAYYLNISPNQDYTIEVGSDLLAFDDQVLTKSVKKSFTSPDINASAQFLQQGSILNPANSEGLPIMAVNLPWIEIDYYRVDRDYYQQLLRDKPTSINYSWSTNRLSKHSTLISSQKYDTSAVRNTKIKKTLATSHIEELNKPGVYLAIMRTPGEYEKYQVAYFNVSTLAAEIREYDNEYLVTVIDQNTSLPATNVVVNVFNRESKQQGSAQTTDKTGQVRLAKSAQSKTTPALVTLTRNNNFNVLNLRSSTPLNLQDFKQGNRESLNEELFIFGPRDLYRRGEQVRYYALLRDADGKSIANLPLPTALIDPQGNEIATSLSKVEQGVYQFEHQFAPDALTGQYTLRFKLGEQSYQHQFSVEDFMPERLEIIIDDALQIVTKAGKIEQALTGLFLYGAPASEHTSDGLIQLKTTDNALTQHPGTYFGVHNNMGTLDSFELESITLDKSGHGNLVIDDRWSQFNQALNIQGYAYLYETGGRKVTKKFKQLWWPQPTLIGIKPAFDNLTSESNQTVGFDLMRSDASGELSSDKVLVSLIRHHQEYYWQHSEQEGWQRLERNDIYPVWQKELNLSAAKALAIDVPVEWGRYQLIVQSTNDSSKASVFFDAGEQWYWRWQENNGNAVRPDQVALALDKASYQAGDQAVVSIDAPYTGTAWLRVESDKLLWQKQVNVTQGSNSINVPIKDWQRHDIYLSTYLIAPADKNNRAKRALGLIPLSLDRQSRQLEVSLNAATKVKPDQLVNLSAQVKNANENTRVVIAAVDVGILNLHQFKTPDPLGFFFAQRQYGVNIRDNFNRIIAPNDLAKANVLWGGGAELAHGGDQAQANVQIVSYFSKPQTVDDKGNAHFELPVPYFNGRLRLFAIAFDEQRFGASEQPLTVADDLVTQISMPRFMAVEDNALFKLDLTNTTNAPLKLSLNISAQGLEIKNQDKSNDKFTLNAGEKRIVEFNMLAHQVTDSAQINLKASGGNIDVNRQWQLSVRPTYPAQRIAKRVIVQPGETHKFAVDQPQWTKQIQSSVSLATRPEFDLTEQVNKLFQFPLGCLEQTSSRLYPWLVLGPNTQQRLTKSLTDIDKNTLIDDGVKRIMSLQTYNGALSLWHSNGQEYPWLSVYGAQVLTQAQQNGVYVQPAKLEKLLKRLSYYLRRGNFNIDGGGENYRFATRAYAALVLAKLGRANQSHMRQLVSKMRHTKSALPVVQLAIAFKLMGDDKRAMTLLDAAKLVKYQRHYGANYASLIRDKALIISLLLEHKLRTSWAQELAFELWDDIKKRQWFSTQERLSLVLADNQLAANFDVEFNYTLHVGEQEFSGPDTFSTFYRLDNGAFNQSSLTNTTPQPLYVNTINQGYPTTPPPYQDDGLTISRDYYDLQGKPISIENLTSGQRFIARVRLQSLKERLRDIMVVDLLPAGIELEHSPLGEQLDLDSIFIGGKKISQLISTHQIDYQGYRDDRYIAAVSVNHRRETQLFYLAQAVTPGTYIHPPVMAQSMYINDVRAVGSAAPTINITSR